MEIMVGVVYVPRDSNTPCNYSFTGIVPSTFCAPEARPKFPFFPKTDLFAEPHPSLTSWGILFLSWRNPYPPLWLT